MQTLDHILWGVPELESGRLDFAERSGVEPPIGGRHPGVGTWNALADLGDLRYFEVIAADPTQDTFSGFGTLLQDLDTPRLLTWCARSTDLDSLARLAADAGLGPGTVESMQRRRPDGTALRWKILMLHGHPFGDLLPFFIQWETLDDHPSHRLPKGLELRGLELLTPDPGPLGTALDALGLSDDVQVVEAGAVGLRAMLESPRGELVLDG